MTAIMIRRDGGPNRVRAMELVANGITATVAEAREVTAEDIHAYIIMQEQSMDVDIIRTFEQFERAVNNNGFSVNFDEVLNGLELSNACWFRQRTMNNGLYEQFIIREEMVNLHHATAQITPTDLLTWLGNTVDPIAYLRAHQRRLVQHNLEFEQVGEAVAKLATEKQYCSEYDRLVEQIIEGFIVTNCPTFGQREKTFDMVVAVTIHVPIQVTAPNQDIAADIAGDQLRSEDVLNMYRNGNYEITDTEFV